MPVTTAGGALILTPSLFGVGMLGLGTPKLASAIAHGLSLWADTRSVTTADVGTLGAGVGVVPLFVPPPLLLAALTPAFIAEGIYGLLAPLFLTGLSTGMSGALLQGLIQTQHPSVGIGAGAGQIKGPPAVQAFLEAFTEAEMVGEGPTKLAHAIGEALDAVFAAYVIPTPIVGPPSPLPSAGVGFGRIV